MFSEYNDILSVGDVCEILFIGKNRAYDLLNANIIQGFRLGRTWRIPKRSLETYIIQKCRSSN